MTAPKKFNLKKALGNLALFFISTAIALAVCELGARVVLNRVDYLSPTLVRDDVLGIRLPGGSGGHDRWGFRNARVPAQAEIVAIGDSHTYGNCAKMNEAWPKVLGKLSGKEVYNLGMGGYGPNQYYHLLQTRALELKPKVIVCGLYLGDDFDNAYRITYGLEHWKPFRREGLGPVDADIWEKETAPNPGFQKRVRNWLSSHSVLYRLVVHGILGGLKGRYQVKNAAALYENAATLEIPEKNVQEAFLPKGVLRGLDPEQDSVKEGKRVTIELLKQMNALCASNQVKFVVAVIPSKETVFARHLEHNSGMKLGETIDKLITGERAAREELFGALKQENIACVDLLPALQGRCEAEKLYTPGASDMHPARNGYRVIGEAISQALAPK